jgi:molybdopterin converting factor small subunit
MTSRRQADWDRNPDLELRAAMKVTVEYGAILREAAGVASEVIDVAHPEVDAVIAEVCRRHPGQLCSWLLDKDSHRLSQHILVAINGIATRERAPELRAGDTILLMPVLAGG